MRMPATESTLSPSTFIAMKSYSLRTGWCSLLIALLALSGSRVAAALSEPPNVLFGFITISNVVAGPDRNDLIVEARRSAAGPAFASYRVGSAAEHGELYFLELPAETAPTQSSHASLPGDLIHVVLRDQTADLARLTYTMGERGRFQRIDFVVGSSSDSNGLPDAWEIAHFGVAGQNPSADPDQDSMSNLQEYLAGTDPRVADPFQISIANTNQQVLITFFARQAAGPGYEGRARFYSLEVASKVEVPDWKPVAGFTNLFGNNQTIVFVVPHTNLPSALYRAQISTR